MKNDNYLNCLRFMLLNDEFCDRRIARLIKNCKKYNYGNVIFFVNSGERYHSHAEIGQVRKEIEGIKKAKLALGRAGITVSLNPITTLGQSFEYSNQTNARGFDTIVGASGKRSVLEACPLDGKFVEYITGLWEYLAAEIKPETMWIEDDFRMNNRPWLGWGGCFCERHMREYGKELGFAVTREQFVNKLLEKGVCNAEYRKAYAKVTRRAMENLARALGDATRRGNAETKMGFMTSVPEEHAVEYRDWKRLFNCADSEYSADRITLPAYQQIIPQEYCWLFNRVAVQTRARIPLGTHVYPELENAPHSPYAKSAAFVRMQIDSASVLVPDGMTINVDGQNSNGVVPEWKYGDALKKEYPFLNAVYKLKLDFSSLSGVTVPYSDESVLHMKPTAYCDYLDNIKPDDSYFSGVLSSWGISYRFKKDPVGVKGEIVAVSGQWLRNFEKPVIEKFFGNNFIILNAEAIETLVEMGLGGLANVSGADWTNSDKANSNWVNHQAASDDFNVYGTDRFVSSVGKCLNVQYLSEQKIDRVYSCLYNEDFVKKGFGIVRCGNVLCFPFIGERRQISQLTPLNEEAVKDFIRNAGLGNPSFITQGKCLSPYYFSKNRVLALCNFSEDDASVSFETPQSFVFKNLFRIKKNGDVEKASFTRKGNVVRTNIKAKGLTAEYLKFN